MIRVFDTMVDEKTKQLERYGVTYKKKNTTRKDKILFYSFEAPGMEPIVVVPYYLQQYRKLEKEIAAVPKGKSAAVYTQLIRTKYDKKATTDTFVDENNVEIPMIIANYQDIEVEFLYQDKKLRMAQRFTVRQNNILGEDVVVDLQGEEA